MNKLIYVCSPYRGDTGTNTKNARKYCRRIVAEGNIPIAPHLLFPQFMDDNIDAERERAMKMNLEIMRRCDKVRVFGGQNAH
jgi:dienelactone hydrolase